MFPEGSRYDSLRLVRPSDAEAVVAHEEHEGVVQLQKEREKLAVSARNRQICYPLPCMFFENTGEARERFLPFKAR